MENKIKLVQKPHNAEEAIIEMMFHYTILMQYSLLDLQNSVRGFVNRMSESVTQLDKIVSTETKPANEMCIKIANHVKDSVKDQKHEAPDPLEVAELLSLLAGLGNLGEKISGPVYTLIECLSFEDIQSQRIEHLTSCFTTLNEGIMQRLEAGLSNYSVEDISVFSEQMRKKTRAMYTMPEERDIFDQVFSPQPSKTD